MSNLTTIIALCGPAGCGKSSVASYLDNLDGARRYSFATPLKEMVKSALDFTDEQVYGTQEQKEAVDPRYGRSPRWFLQRIGTEGCRNTFGKDFWTKQCLDTIWRQNPRLAIIEDMRFADEADAVLNDPRFNGFVWRIHPVPDAVAEDRAAAAGIHASEGEWRHLDASLELQPTVRGLEHLFKIVDAAMEFMPLRPVAGGVGW